MKMDLIQDDQVAIRVQDLSKCYRIGLKEKVELRQNNILYAFGRLLKKPIDNFRKYRSLYRFDDVNTGNGDEPTGGNESVIWALRNISFDVKMGDVLGIVGRNGAGKSTLLKILSKITLPTQGKVEIRGRVSSLLEVGTGFHPELTGRENIFLNGTILGMKKTEVIQKFDEIVDFSGVEKFIDTPVKRYSSGMKVRLAFSVAAYLEPEILLIDEVLAVGDTSFQKKCLGKMEDISNRGRTVLFVSHNMAAVAHLCNRILHLKKDHIVQYDDPEQGIMSYLQEMHNSDGSNDLQLRERSKDLQPVINRIELLDKDDNTITSVPSCGQLGIKIYFEHNEPLKDPYFGIFFESQMGIRIFWLQTQLQKGILPDLPSSGSIICRVPKLPVVPGQYYLSVGCGASQRQLDLIGRACSLTVYEADVFGTGRLPKPKQGMVLVDAEWEVVDGHSESLTKVAAK